MSSPFLLSLLIDSLSGRFVEAKYLKTTIISYAAVITISSEINQNAHTHDHARAHTHTHTHARISALLHIMTLYILYPRIG